MGATAGGNEVSDFKCETGLGSRIEKLDGSSLVLYDKAERRRVAGDGDRAGQGEAGVSGFAAVPESVELGGGREGVSCIRAP